MRNMLVAVLLLGGCAFGASVYAQAPTGAPSGSTGLCKDGTYTSGTNKRSACRGHKGVKDWYAAAAEPSAAGSSHAESKKSRSKKHAEEHESASAAASSARPADATGLCKDGTYTTGTNKRSACRGHKGVKDWYAAKPEAGKSTKASHEESASKAATANAAPSGAAPANATGLCKDGSYTTGTNKRSACRGHKGVKDWYAAEPEAGKSTKASHEESASKAATANAAPSAPVAPMPSHQPAASPPMTMPPTHRPPELAANPMPGGGPGMVWVNTESKVYHCQSSRWYGRTKQGKYMTEAQAEAQGFRAEHGKTCG